MHFSNISAARRCLSSTGSPSTALSLTRWRQRMGAERLQALLGVGLRQSYARVGKFALIKHQRYAHAHQFKRAGKALRKLRTYLGRVIRDIRRRIAGEEDLREAFVRPLYLRRARAVAGPPPARPQSLIRCTRPRWNASARARPDRHRCCVLCQRVADDRLQRFDRIALECLQQGLLVSADCSPSSTFPPNTGTISARPTRSKACSPQCAIEPCGRRGALSAKTAKLMVFKLVDAAAKTWRRLKGENQLPKVIAGIKFQNGIEVIKMPAHHAA